MGYQTSDPNPRMANSLNLAKRIATQASKQLKFDKDAALETKTNSLKAFLKAETAAIKAAHREGASGMEVVKGLSALIDFILEELAKPVLEELRAKTLGTVSIVAIGGYGRAELCPQSDIDIMFLYPEKADKEGLAIAQDIIIRGMLYPLWDTGLKVGHSSRTVENAFEEARADIQTKTALLESRLIAGSRPLYESYRSAYILFYRKEEPKRYIEKRLLDQRERRARYGDSVFMQEPDIKNGVGGLRDYHNTLWMARVRLKVDNVEGLAELNYLRKDELGPYREAYDYLLRVRNELHFRSKRPTDLLSLEMQPKVALSLGFSEKNIMERVERFMRIYYEHAQRIFHISRTIENRLSLGFRQEPKSNPLASMKRFLLARRKERVRQVDGFEIRGSRVVSQEKTVFTEDPIRLIRVFRHRQQNHAEIDLELSTLIRSSLDLIDDSVILSSDAAKAFRSILQETGNVCDSLSSMHEHGVLGRYIPEWGKLTCLVQHEYFHRYTADIHTLHTIRELDAVFTSPDKIFESYRREIHELRLPNLLYLILFLHDIGKALGARDHASNGVEMAEAILERLEIEAENRELVRFIIEQHLVMARFWQRYDLDDPSTATAFAEQMESAERLRLLYIHTFCDARGTAKGLWNNYKDTLHRTLFSRTMEVFKSDESLEKRQERQKEMTQLELLKLDIPNVGAEEINAHFQLLPDRYFINTSNDEIILHIRMVNELLREIAQADTVGALNPIIDWQDDLNRSMIVVNVLTWDRAGLFHKLAGALNIAGFNILSAKAISRDDHIAIDTFYVVENDRGASSQKDSRTVFEEAVREALVSNNDLYPRIQSIMRKADQSLYRRNENPLAESFQPVVDVYHEISLDRTILEIQAKDHPGLLYQISRSIYEHGMDITFARINTERGIAIDTLYLSNGNNGHDKTDNQKLVRLRDAISEVLMKDYERLNSA